ncbi:MAG: YrhA family protein [Treponema sp.]|nr:YrhA family protein [Treponema sp.]
MYKTYDDILNAVAEHGAMIVRPASEKDLKLCQKDMKELDFPPIPQQYAGFLKLLNGFAWNGIEFFSTDQVTDLETGFMLNDIVSANEYFVEYNNDFLNVKNYVQLGRADEDLYVYNIGNGRYEVLDMTGRDVMEDFETFEEMFAGVVSPRI